MNTDTALTGLAPDLLRSADAILIQPFRWVDPPVLAYWIGSGVLAVGAVCLGLLTLRVAQRVIGAEARDLTEQARRHQELSMQALEQGDKAAYDACNSVANEAFGRTFFLHLALGMGSLWPAFLAAGWLELRFGEVRLDAAGLSFGFLAPFVISYILARVGLPRALARLSFSGGRSS